MCWAVTALWQRVTAQLDALDENASDPSGYRTGNPDGSSLRAGVATVTEGRAAEVEVVSACHGVSRRVVGVVPPP